LVSFLRKKTKISLKRESINRSNHDFGIIDHANMKKLVTRGECFALSLVYLVGLVSSILPVSAQSEYVIFPETASVSSSGLTPLNFMLKAISKPSGDVEKVSGFKLDPVNVLSISTNGVISAISTDESMVFEQAKAKSSTDSLYELQKATIQGQPQQQLKSGFSIAGLAPGVYTLDLIGTKNGAKAAYEGILIIGQDKESPQVKQVIKKEINEVQQVTTIIDIVTIFQAPPPQPQSQAQPQLLPTGPIAQLRPPGGGGAGIGPLGKQPQQLAAIPLGGQGQPLSLSPSPLPSPSPSPGQCPQGFEGIPPQCTPIGPENEPTDPLSLDPSYLDPNDPKNLEDTDGGEPGRPENEPTDPLSLDPSYLDPNDPENLEDTDGGEPGVLGEQPGEGGDTENLEDTDGGETESDSESGDNGGEEEEGDGRDSDFGEDGGDGGDGGE
jgi:hypothetical protein